MLTNRQFLLTFLLLFTVIFVANSLSLSAQDFKQVKSQQLKPEKYSDCGLTPEAKSLAELVINDPLQTRPALICNKLLSRVADAKAKEMAELGRVSHIGRSAANRRLIEGGYKLAAIYPRMFENNVEAIAGGIKDPGETWEAFKESLGHRTHLLAENEFYRIQNEIGVGFYKDLNSPHIYYWVIFIAHQTSNVPFAGEVAKSKD